MCRLGEMKIGILKNYHSVQIHVYKLQYKEKKQLESEISKQDKDTYIFVYLKWHYKPLDITTEFQKEAKNSHEKNPTLPLFLNVEFVICIKRYSIYCKTHVKSVFK